MVARTTAWLSLWFSTLVGNSCREEYVRKEPLLPPQSRENE